MSNNVLEVRELTTKYITRFQEDIYAVGNAAGDGARIALLNKDKRVEADRIAREVEYIELTAEPGFEEAFIAATHFPDVRSNLA